MNPEEYSSLRLALKKAYSNSKYWKKIFNKSKYNSKNFKFTDIPFLTKQDLLNDQKNKKPFGEILSVSDKEILRVHKTSGTSTAPLMIFLTKKDIESVVEIGAKTFRQSGLNKNDRIIHCLNFNMWSGGVTDYLSLEETGATCIPFGTGNTEMLIQTIKKLKINAISCTPSYIFKIYDKCQELGINFKSLKLKKGFFGGENFIQISNMRKIIEKKFGISAIDANYGLSEVLSIIGGENQNKNGLIFNAQGILYPEIIDKKGKNTQIKKGAEGELVLTTLKKEAQPLFRYRTNDTIKILESFNEKENGLARFRFRIIGRTDEMFNIKGVNFFPESISGLFDHIKQPLLSTKYKIKRFKISEKSNFKTTIIISDVIRDKNKKKQIEFNLKEKSKTLLSISLNVVWVSEEKFQLLTSNNNKNKLVI
jgi:phenylacetate-CoA ligase|tara:strand:- start:189 stop:1457 length:1269 start_codon:yes stop_codon:yes gene_type:complete